MDYLQQGLHGLAKLPQAAIARVLTLLLAVYAIYIASQLTWMLVPETQEQAAVWRPSVQQSGQSGALDLTPVQRLSLFGDVDKSKESSKPKPVDTSLITDAPKTTLRILLTGLVASSEQERGIAVIESAGSQETYGIGDKIKSTSASLHEVYADRAIIVNRGRYETLMLDGIEYSKTISEETKRLKTRSSEPRTQDMRNNNKVSAQLDAARTDLLTDPGKLTDYISISPVKADGGLKGYRLNPGKDRALFTDAGLKSGDLAVAINGYDLTQMSEAMQLLAELPELTEMAVMVEREGQLTEIMFSLPNQK
ncbi:MULTISPECIES: type II secretion system protein GspC [Ferrimonas]|uniref:type II secretion system protein GspC n=1 Tax=Ferrimonas TaxID=44011 RepID=UPI000421EEA0|nr:MULTISPECIES: type II secretion system protein GspC [Ferrimonas]USD37799.1 type II secretion system protein GspC [Ferrimonas sp. SCSIO 43195]